MENSSNRPEENVFPSPIWFPSEIQTGLVLAEDRLDMNGKCCAVSLSLGEVSQACEKSELPLCVCIKDEQGNESLIEGKISEEEESLVLRFEKSSGLDFQFLSCGISILQWEHVLNSIIQSKNIHDRMKSKILKQL